MWFRIVYTLIDNEYPSSQWSKCCGLTRHSHADPQQILTTVTTHIILDKNTIIDLFFTTISISTKNFFRAQAEKGIVQHMDASSVVWTLTDEGKLANQIARLVAIVVNNLTYYVASSVNRQDELNPVLLMAT